MTEKSLKEKFKEAASHTLVYGVGSVLQTALGFILLPLYTGHFSAEVFGVFSLIVLVGTLAGAVFFLGASSALSRSYYDYSDAHGRSQAIGTCLYITLAGAFIQIVLGFLFANDLSSLLFNSTKYGREISLVCFSAAVAFINTLLFLLLRFERRSKEVVILNLVLLVAGTSLAGLLVAVLRLGILGAVVAEMANRILAMIVLLFLLRRSLAFSFSGRELKLQLEFGIPTVLNGLAYYLLTSVDRFVLSRYASLHDVGVYSVGYKISMLINVFLILPFGQIWTPMRMQYRFDTNAGSFYSKVLTFYCMAGMTFIVAMSAFSRQALELFVRGVEYQEAYRIIPLIAGAQFLYGAVGIIDGGILFARKILYYAYIFWAVVVVNIGLNFLLTPTFGFIGASVATLITFCILTAAVAWISNRLMVVQWESRRLLKVALIGVGALGAIAALDAMHYRRPFFVSFGLLLGFIGLLYVWIFDSREKAFTRNILGHLRGSRVLVA